MMSVSLPDASAARGSRAAVEDRILAPFAGAGVDWSNAEQALDTAGPLLRQLHSDPELLREAIGGLSSDRWDAERGQGGAYWFNLATEEQGVSVWLRFCPTGCVAPPHEHRSPLVALVIAGGFKQTLIGIGGGVASGRSPVELYRRHERQGQVFALHETQEHESSSTAGSLILVATPPAAVGSSGGEDEDLRAKAEAALQRLQRDAGALLRGEGWTK